MTGKTDRRAAAALPLRNLDTLNRGEAAAVRVMILQFLDYRLTNPRALRTIDRSIRQRVPWTGRSNWGPVT